MVHTHTYTYVKYYDADTVDKLGPVYSELEVDYLRRKDHVSPKVQVAMKARLDLLRNAWLLLLDVVPNDE